MATSDSTSGRVSLEEAVAKTVGEVMIRAPKTLPSDALVGDVRQAFARSSMRTVLLSDETRFAGAIERQGLPSDALDTAPAREYAERKSILVTPEMPMSEAVKLLERRGEPRLIVVDEDGVTLRGLLCGNGDAGGFCVR